MQQGGNLWSLKMMLYDFIGWLEVSVYLWLSSLLMFELKFVR